MGKSLAIVLLSALSVISGCESPKKIEVPETHCSPSGRMLEPVQVTKDEYGVEGVIYGKLEKDGYKPGEVGGEVGLWKPGKTRLKIKGNEVGVFWGFEGENILYKTDSGEVKRAGVEKFDYTGGGD